MRSHTLSRHAVADLEDIIRYTYHRWGAGQIETYRGQLGACLAAITQGTAHERALGGAFAGVRRSRCQQHAIFFRRGQNMVEVLAIFHRQRNWEALLRARIGGPNGP